MEMEMKKKGPGGSPHKRTPFGGHVTILVSFPSLAITRKREKRESPLLKTERKFKTHSLATQPYVSLFRVPNLKFRIEGKSKT